jgi:hypothetical protein
MILHQTTQDSSRLTQEKVLNHDKPCIEWPVYLYVPCNGEGVQFLVLQRFADVLHALGRLVPFLLDGGAAGCEQAGIGINQIRDLYAFEAEVLVDVALTLPVNAGHADADDIVCAQHAAGGLGPGNRDRRRRREGVLQKTASSQVAQARFLSSLVVNVSRPTPAGRTTSSSQYSSRSIGRRPRSEWAGTRRGTSPAPGFMS